MGNCMARIDLLTSNDKNRLEHANLDHFAVMMAFKKLDLCTMREMERLFIAFDHIGPPLMGQKDVVAVEDVIRFLGIVTNSFMDQVFTAPVKMEKDFEEYKRVAAGGKKKTPEELRDEHIRRQSLASTTMPSLTFGQFCMSLWMLTFIEMPSLAFNMYDKDGSGTLDLQEVKDLVHHVYGSTGGAGEGGNDGIDIKVQQVLDGIDADHDGVITKPEFAALVHNFHYLLLPAFTVQNRCRNKIFGGYIDWVREEEKQQATQYTTLVDIVKRIDREAQEQIAVHAGDIEKLKEKVLGDSFETKDGDMIKLMAPVDKYGVQEAKDLAENDKSIVEGHRKHRAL